MVVVVVVHGGGGGGGGGGGAEDGPLFTCVGETTVTVKAPAPGEERVRVHSSRHGIDLMSR